jgi:hypothetical protein
MEPSAHRPLALCFAFDDPGGVHLRALDSDETLCGQRALMSTLSRRLVTCSACKQKKRELPPL